MDGGNEYPLEEIFQVDSEMSANGKVILEENLTLEISEKETGPGLDGEEESWDEKGLWVKEHGYFSPPVIILILKPVPILL